MMEVLFYHKYTAAVAAKGKQQVSCGRQTFGEFTAVFHISLAPSEGREDGHKGWKALLSFTTLTHPSSVILIFR